MSWSVHAEGKAPAVAKRIKEQLADIRCAEPEETIKNGAASIIDVALSAFGPDMVVKVAASGSQATWRDHPEGTFANCLKVDIEPVYGFVE